MNNNKGWGKIIIRKVKNELRNGLREKNLEDYVICFGKLSKFGDV